MRELKFRAWGKRSQGDSIMYSPFSLSEMIKGDWPKDDTGFIWMQYTGLKDKNGTPIYEGDILEHLDKNYVVRWDEHMAAFQTQNPRDSVDADFFNWGNIPSLQTLLSGVPEWRANCEVIGNIYEHKHLLEEDK